MKNSFLLFFIGIVLAGCQKESLITYSEEDTYTKVAIFGGSYTIIPESETVKSLWRKAFGFTITNYGVGGAGFSNLTGEHNIQSQINAACKPGVTRYDIYLLWASTNDFRKCPGNAGFFFDYTEGDAFDVSVLITQCGGINYCIKKIREKAPNAKILFFSSSPIFGDVKGYDTSYEGSDGMAYFVEMQRQCCEKQCVPFLDQFSDSPLTKDNWQRFFNQDGIHLNEAGYRLIAVNQNKFIERIIRQL